ncbi:hypothetical protein [Ekhidna sp.]|uniref:hypothetical protein n=1 Tax=Ekhidna sp. TaxID=2608089 RepID=UPI003B50FC91
MKRLIILLCYVSLISCQDKVICPAFQSTYILDDSTRYAYFSYVWQLDENTRTQYLAQQNGQDPDDTLGVVQQPKTDYYAYAGEKVVPWRIQKQTKYGIVKNTPYPIKKYRLRTAPMENVLAPDPVSNDFVASDFGIDSLSIASDSLGLDSLATTAIAVEEEEKPKYLYGYQPDDNFNVEQEYYNKYYSYKFIDNRPKPKPAPTDTSAVAAPDSVQVKERKGLFKRRKKSETDTEESTDPPAEENTEEEGQEPEGENGNG